MESAPYPENDRVGHVVVAWHDLTLVWGGHNERYEYWDPSVIYCHQDGIWAHKTTYGEIPPGVESSAGEVINDYLYVACGNLSTEFEINDLYSLNLDTWMWSKLDPEGTKPLKCSKLVSWVSGEKMYLFGGEPNSDNNGKEEGAGYPESLEFYTSGSGVANSSNQLVCYDPKENSWSWPSSSGSIPSPRYGHAAFSVTGHFMDSNSLEKRFRSLAFIFGGELRRGWPLSDLYFLDMETMKWEEVVGTESSWPIRRVGHSLTLVSENVALLHGGFHDWYDSWQQYTQDKQLGDCWLLNIEKCIAVGNAEDITGLSKETEDLPEALRKAVKNRAQRKYVVT